ncbi:S-adenosyl-L-methionine-dependent methyltransferase [Boeremia exigua]|uniref:S-adenosyl-L-methionine-dependent methyltransferase n=1 Tax=Boeremia exigua TaxID=749465 RepID=UPI001E8D3BA5|nr:S-adenosyl-L-methionine-dependent methyltransferase [Boeremia exigua]KAH6644075.1 S-adenosyl-L-methionine-dependent methyltransferase [Boeremia exigua]
MSTRQKRQSKPKASVPAAPPTPTTPLDAERQPQYLPASALLKNVTRALALILIAGVASPVSQLNLSPVFGSIPASLHHQQAMTLTALGGLGVRRLLKGYLSVDVSAWVTVLAYWIPLIQCYLFPHSTQLGIDYGPLIVESLTYFPLLFLSMYAVSDLLDTVDFSRWDLPSALGDAILPMSSYIGVSFIARIFGGLLPTVIGQHVYLTRVGFQMLLASASAFITPSKLLFLAFPAILHTLWINPHNPADQAFQSANSTLVATHNYTILARQESLTGYVSVVENYADNAFRLMRCDHSLLGGEWLVTPESYKKGQRQKESIFAVFVLLEAVRLVENPELEPIGSIPRALDVKPTPESEKSALVIGLGIGTAPNALIKHGLNTTIVELDPVVHKYATEFFGLSPEHTAVISDAVRYVADTSVSAPKSYDYIIHDVFTGGAEPVYLFTTEFMQGLHALLKDDGVVAINYAGDLTLGSTKLVLNTIHAVFPACRLFRDTAAPDDHKEGDSDFINMVIFCVKNDLGMGKKAIGFRKATQKDFLGSLARRNFLQPREELEVKYEYTEGAEVMGRADVAELEAYHEEGAVSHWKIMRSVLPAGVWEMW